MEHPLQLVYLMLPVYFANMAPPFAKFWPGWNRPIHERSLGSHKTVVGFGFGVASGVITAYLQSLCASPSGLLDYDAWFSIGLACGLGAMLGDCAKSYVKRRLDFAPGQSWFPMDQLDFVLGGLIALSFWIDFSWSDIAWIVGLSLLGDILVNHLSFRLRIRDTKW